ncbi:MAG: hypothetical protein BMS9Abin05_0703 [Rhodothermia bacterium]|nr:MAG: hypothetical protein BMS9Abin05_0703 [Rhodothermia bacterium]
MIRRLRAAHRWIFVVLAILITGAILASIVYRPKYPFDSIRNSLVGSSRNGNSVNDSSEIQQ